MRPQSSGADQRLKEGLDHNSEHSRATRWFLQGGLSGILFRCLDHTAEDRQQFTADFTIVSWSRGAAFPRCVCVGADLVIVFDCLPRPVRGK